jgi:CoA:oxalate CoA-transferase
MASTSLGPLAGIRILDLTSFLSGPFCTQILADLGAEIIKVEPIEGDSSRHIPPYFVEEDSAYYLSHNRSKRSIAVNLKTLDGSAIVKRLVAECDVVVENYRPGVAARLGLDPEELRRAHVGLIWVSISGFGQTGPWRDQPAYDIVVQALAGVMSLTGAPGSDAMRLGIPAGDLVAGMYAVIAALAALVERGRTGQGRWADISMLDGQLSMLSYQAAYATVGGITPRPQSNRHDSIPTYRGFRAGDGREFVVAANTDRMWRALCAVLEVEYLLTDRRFGSAADRLKNEEALAKELEDAVQRRNATDLVADLIAQSVPAAMVKTVPEALEDARQADRGMSLVLESPHGQPLETVGSPLQWIGEPPREAIYPPSLGADTSDVLAELGYSLQQIEKLSEDAVIRLG